MNKVDQMKSDFLNFLNFRKILNFGNLLEMVESSWKYEVSKFKKFDLTKSLTSPEEQEEEHPPNRQIFT